MVPMSLSQSLRSLVVPVSAGLLAALLVSCGGDSSTEPTPSNQPAQVQVSPATATLTSVGATQQLSATVRDAQGAVLAGAAVTWSSSNGSSASVSSTGLVEAMGEGTALITASSGSASGQATVSVQLPAPVAASVEITPAAVTLSSAGATEALTAVVRDSGGAEIAGAPVTWSSSDDGVATVSSSGVVTAVASGAATITATSGAAQGQAQVAVDLPPAPFITTWQVEPAELAIKIPTTGGGYNYTVYWENTANPAQNGTLTGQTGSATFTVPEAGLYRVEISGQFPRIFFPNSTANTIDFLATNEQIRTVEQWGDIAWSSMQSAFSGARNLNVVATDAPDLTNVTSLRSMFLRARSMNGPIGHWMTDNVTTMRAMFDGATSFNQPIDYDPVTGAWNTGNVTDMEDMFDEAEAFNQDLNGWDVSQVTNMREMFKRASSFNGEIGAWNTSNVTSMNQMFDAATAFNQDISGWDVSNVTQFGDMFEQASSFNQDISGWDTSSGRGFTDMFRDATSFDQDLGNWNIGAATSFARMFDGSGMSVENYDATLTGWAGFVNANGGPKGMALNSGSLQYCAGGAGRQSLISDHGWNILDGGVAPGCFPADAYWVAVADGSGGGATLATSPDGVTWTARTTPFDDQGRGVAWNGSLWVATGQENAMIATSPDGENWTARTAPFTTEGIGVAWGGGLWVAVGRGSTTIATSPDGITWTARNNPLTTRARGVAWNGTMWMAGGVGDSTVATSPDGITWTGIASPLDETVRGVAWNGSQWLLTGRGAQGFLATSPDGSAWTVPTTPFTSNSWRAVWGGAPGVPAGGGY